MPLSRRPLCLDADRGKRGRVGGCAGQASTIVECPGNSCASCRSDRNVGGSAFSRRWGRRNRTDEASANTARVSETTIVGSGSVATFGFGFDGGTQKIRFGYFLLRCDRDARAVHATRPRDA